MYRIHVRSIERGNTYFLADNNSLSRYTQDDKVNHVVKLSSTFFKMVHECVYVWGKVYFNHNQSKFREVYDRLKDKISFPKYPEEFKFYTQARVDLFKVTKEKNLKIYEKEEK